jgi:hypothetical protein
MSAFANALDQSGEKVPLKHSDSRIVTAPEPPRSGVPTLAGFELWLPPHPNVYKVRQCFLRREHQSTLVSPRFVAFLLSRMVFPSFKY